MSEARFQRLIRSTLEHWLGPDGTNMAIHTCTTKMGIGFDQINPDQINGFLIHLEPVVNPNLPYATVRLMMGVLRRLAERQAGPKEAEA